MEGWKKRIEVDMHEAGPYGGIAPPPDRCPTGLGCGDTPLAALLSEGCPHIILGKHGSDCIHISTITGAQRPLKAA